MSLLSTPYIQESQDSMRRRRIVKKGFQLCIMVCGRTGTGKSTFVNTLCDGTIFESSEPSEVFAPDGVTREMQIRTHKVELCEADGTVIVLTVVDTPGFGHNIDNTDCSKKICEYLESQFDEVLIEESRVRRNPHFQDNRVHACLYFIPPTGHGLRELDAELMNTLSERVNVIPIISKSDTLTDEELIINKTKIMADIEKYRINIFDFNCSKDETDSLRDEYAQLQAAVPFAITGSNDVYRVEDSEELVRGRWFPWGLVRIEDPSHSDFVLLRSVLFGSHLQELRDLTNDFIYEKYRTDKLSEKTAEKLAEVSESEERDHYASELTFAQRQLQNESLRKESLRSGASFF